MPRTRSQSAALKAEQAGKSTTTDNSKVTPLTSSDDHTAKGKTHRESESWIKGASPDGRAKTTAKSSQETHDTAESSPLLEDKEPDVSDSTSKGSEEHSNGPEEPPARASSESKQRPATESPRPVDATKSRGDEALTAPSSDSDSDSDGSSSSDDGNHVDITERTDIPENLKQRVNRLKALRSRMSASMQDNRKDVFAAFQASKQDPNQDIKAERKRRHAEILQLRDHYEETGQDYERSRFWDYSIERVGKYKEKQKEREARVDRGFTDWNQVTKKKYDKMISEFRPDLNAYEQQKALIKSLGTVSGYSSESNAVLDPRISKPAPQAIDRVVAMVTDQEEKRSKFSRRRPTDEDEDITYINDRNAHFNRKLARAFDKYTKDIRDSFERGTAL
ncbi:pre-mRNA-splicing factor SYF2 [Spiromyces aspiralis]|uniref:Pre-mRNA-splicing factor SYF2 n=1 Tax=Spiromyces aspiralis TaxID=68401 RepID=A0ACC1HE63_9FUNG|nr:pre-mRNA-splicing factor SYF2 [Spiromyces aspiralis]